ncbi:MAG: AI-2E family transporter [Clostridia bacterium]|nr:AI-2E family transporter [Clostridia bacterium]
MKEIKNWTKWIYWFTFSIAVIFVYKTLDNFTDISIWLGKLVSILMPFLVGILMAYLFYIPCRQIEKLYRNTKYLKKRARGLSVLTVYIMAILVLTIVINIVIPSISKSIKDLSNNLPTYYQNAIDYVENMPEDSIIKKESAKEIISKLELIDITKILSIENVSDYIKKAIGVAGAIFSGFVTIVMSVYILLERGEILKFIKKLNSALFKKETCTSLNNYFMKANDIFFKFISSQVLDAIIVGVIVSIAMKILGVKYWILLGFMIGLFNVIPYFGSIVAIAISSIITIFTGGFAKAIWTLIVVVILQQIDANVINPKIVGNALKLSPILVIFSVTVFGAYFGILGMFLAVPIIAVIKILINDFIEYRIEKKELNQNNE